MKITDQSGQVREMPVYGRVTGLKITSLELTPKDLRHLLAESDSQVREWLNTMAVRFTEERPANRDCPHAAPHRFCESCVSDPCPIGLGKKA